MKNTELLAILMLLNMELVAQSPDTASIAGPTTVCRNETNLVYTTAFTSGATYTWSVPREARIVYGQGSSIIIVNWGSKKGSVDVVIEGAGGTVSKTIKIKIGECSFVSLDTPESEEVSTELPRIYPNPFTQQFTLEFRSEMAEENGRLLVFDASGVLRKTQEVRVAEGENKIPVELPQLSPGKYVVYIHYGAVVQKVRGIRDL